MTTEQIAFDNGITWSIIDHNRRTSGLWSLVAMPEVNCPIVDTSPVTSNTAIARIMSQHISPLGVKDPEELVAALEAAGCVVRYPAGAFHIQTLAQTEANS